MGCSPPIAWPSPPTLTGIFPNGKTVRCIGLMSLGRCSWAPNCGKARTTCQRAWRWHGTLALSTWASTSIDPDLYQPFFARGIQIGDTFALMLEAGFRKNFLATEPTGDEYTLYFSPGNFAGVKPSIFSDEDYLPPRPQPHNYMQEIYSAWKKTGNGYSGDIAIPVTFFEGGKFAPGYELGLGFSVMKAIRPARPTDAEDLERVVLQSKKDHLFRVSAGNPSSFPRVVLVEGKP